MDCECEPRFKGIADNIIKTEHDYFEKSLKLHYKCDPDKRCILNIMRYLNSMSDWKNYKFNQYSVKKNDNDFIIIFNYIAPKPVFTK